MTYGPRGEDLVPVGDAAALTPVVQAGVVIAAVGDCISTPLTNATAVLTVHVT